MKQGAPDRASGWYAATYLWARGSSDGGTLFVEVHDDRFMAGDRIEVRLGRPIGGSACAHDSRPARVFSIDANAPATSAPPLAARRVRETSDVRTFAITLPKSDDFDPSLGIGLDVIDQDPTAARTISTTPSGPELGALLFIDGVACGRTAAGPVALPLPPVRN